MEVEDTERSVVSESCPSPAPPLLRPPSALDNFPLVCLTENVEKGRHLVAATDIPVDTLVMLSPPYTWAVDEAEKQSTCRHCMGPVTSEQRDEGATYSCAKCKDVWYCSK